MTQQNLQSLNCAPPSDSGWQEQLYQWQHDMKKQLDKERKKLQTANNKIQLLEFQLRLLDKARKEAARNA